MTEGESLFLQGKIDEPMKCWKKRKQDGPSIC